MRGPITLDQIEKLAAAWYSALDIHAPITECYRMLADDGLNMHFPSGDIHNFAMFEKWYARVTSRFFDEQHTIRQIGIKWCTDEQAEIEAIIRWQASWWEPPAAKSQRLDLEAAQTWTVRRCPLTKNPYGLEFIGYIIAQNIKYAPNSAQLPPSIPGDETSMLPGMAKG